MNNLLGRQVDSNYVVRMYCIRGLGNMADIGETKVNIEAGSLSHSLPIFLHRFHSSQQRF